MRQFIKSQLAADTDRFSVGANVDALVFTATDVGYGTNRFYYLRHDGSGRSTFGTIAITGLTSGTVTDRFAVGTNVTELTFAAADVLYGPNLFYYLRGAPKLGCQSSQITYTTNTVTTVTTNTVTTVTTNIVPSVATDTITASGNDICQSRTVIATTSCPGSIQGVQPVIGGPGVPPTRYSNGAFSLSFATQIGGSYTVQYKNSLSDPAWTDLPNMPVSGTGGALTITDSTGGQPRRFYRVFLTP